MEHIESLSNVAIRQSFPVYTQCSILNFSRFSDLNILKNCLLSQHKKDLSLYKFDGGCQTLVVDPRPYIIRTLM